MRKYRKDWLSSTGNRLISESYGERMSCIYGGLSGVARNDLEQRITYYLERLLLQSIRIKNAAIIWWYEETCRTHTGTS